MLTAMLGSSECVFFPLSAILSERMEEGKREEENILHRAESDSSGVVSRPGRLPMGMPRPSAKKARVIRAPCDGFNPAVACR